ncbi:MAG: hypothetical protein HY606_05940 [Planctomycetes bacterium]|nr:hypothetical protein [Planctomycetota bacterium]
MRRKFLVVTAIKYIFLSTLFFICAEWSASGEIDISVNSAQAAVITIGDYTTVQSGDRTVTRGIALPRSEPGEDLTPWYKDPYIKLIEDGMQGGCINCHISNESPGFLETK